MAAIAAQMIEFLASIFMMRCRSRVEGQRAATQIVRGSAQALVCASEGTLSSPQNLSDSWRYADHHFAPALHIGPPLPHVCGLPTLAAGAESFADREDARQVRRQADEGHGPKGQGACALRSPSTPPSRSLLTTVLYHVSCVSCARGWCDDQVRQSMARIKLVLGERQHIYKTFKREQILALVRRPSVSCRVLHVSHVDPGVLRVVCCVCGTTGAGSSRGSAWAPAGLGRAAQEPERQAGQRQAAQAPEGSRLHQIIEPIRNKQCS